MNYETTGKIGFIFDGTFDGFLTMVHIYFYDKIMPYCIVEKDDFQQMLDVNYSEIVSDLEKSKKVLSGIKSKIGNEFYTNLFRGFLHFDKERYINLFKYTVAGFKLGKKIDYNLSFEYVKASHDYAKFVGRESHLFTGFVRFEESKEGVLYSKIEPKSNVLPILSIHFADRFINEKWIIHDTKRNIASIYDGEKFAIFSVDKMPEFEVSEREESFQRLWKTFFDAVAIKERISKKRQDGILPKRYRTNMLEMKESNLSSPAKSIEGINENNKLKIENNNSPS